MRRKRPPPRTRRKWTSTCMRLNGNFYPLILNWLKDERIEIAKAILQPVQDERIEITKAILQPVQDERNKVAKPSFNQFRMSG